jgi:hypothetical protein
MPEQRVSIAPGNTTLLATIFYQCSLVKHLLVVFVVNENETTGLIIPFPTHTTMV